MIMKRTMIYTVLLTTLLVVTACDDNDPVLTDKNLPNTKTFLSSAESSKQDIYYKPYVGYVGDPMPFYDPVAQDFKVLYLQDFRPNPEVTYHPIWCVSTKDASTYTSLGEIIPCGTASEVDAALGTGSTIYHEGTYYTFYTGHTTGKEVVMLATSKDFKSWTKDKNLLLTPGDKYSIADFRDPFVFKDDDNLFHLLIATKLQGKGVLAEYTSTDLLTWTNVGEFMTCMWDRFYECPDVFKMGDWWYLVYSDQTSFMRKIQYFKGHTLDDLKACTANDAGLWPDDHEGFLDSRGLYAGKTATNGTDRFLWGWCATKEGSNNVNKRDWAGTLVAHKLIQHEDGTLSLGEVQAISGLFTNSTTQADVTLSDMGYKLFPRLGEVNRLSFTVTTTDKFGISFARGTDSEKYYTLVVNPEEGGAKRKINFEEEGIDAHGFIGDNDGYLFPTPADGVYNIVITTDNSTLTMYINDNVCYTNRIYGLPKNPWSINSYGADISVTNLRVAIK